MGTPDDRTYYRMRSNRDLIEAAETAPSPELAVVLSERLAAARSGWPQNHTYIPNT